MESNKFICRGISKDTNEFVYGYYSYDNEENKHFISNWATDCPDGIRLVRCTLDIEIIQEPDRFYKEVNGIKLFENDEIQYTVKGFNQTLDCVTTEIIDSICELEIDLVASIKSGEITDLEIIGNTHFNNLTGDKNV